MFSFAWLDFQRAHELYLVIPRFLLIQGPWSSQASHASQSAPAWCQQSPGYGCQAPQVPQPPVGHPQAITPWSSQWCSSSSQLRTESTALSCPRSWPHPAHLVDIPQENHGFSHLFPMKHGVFQAFPLSKHVFLKLRDDVHPMSGHGSLTSPKPNHRSLLVEPAPEPPLRSCGLHPPQTWYHPRPGDVHLRSAHKILGFPNQRDKGWMIFGFPPWKPENINQWSPLIEDFPEKQLDFRLPNLLTGASTGPNIWCSANFRFTKLSSNS